MKFQGDHGMLPQQTQDEHSRHQFLVEMKETLYRSLAPGLTTIYESRAKPVFEKKHGRLPKDRHDVAEVMEHQEYYQMWSALARAQHELYVDSTTATVERQLPELVDRFRMYADKPKYGSLCLNNEFEIPSYQSKVDIHCVPGGYCMELTDDDVYTGARYDIGFYMYSLGNDGPYNDAMAKGALAYLSKHFQNVQPKKILDLGCTGGFCSIPYVDAFPEAMVHAIDISAPCLRYAHARAESLGKAVHFSQQNAEHTHFEDSSFDLIVSHILLHETSRKAVYNIMKECFRLLKPGGVCLHLEVPVKHRDLEPLEQYLRDWSTFNNNEPFWGTLHDMDIMDPIIKAGFQKEHVFDDYTLGSEAEFLASDRGWTVFGAQKATDIDQ